MLRSTTGGFIIILLFLGVGIPGTECWYQALTPGLTRDDIHRLAGPPAVSETRTERYAVPDGALTIHYHDDALLECTCAPTTGGQLDLYHTAGEPLTTLQRTARQTYLLHHDLSILPHFDGMTIRASGETGICYPVDDRYVVIDPIIDGSGQGFFVDKAASVTVVDHHRQRTVLYRAIDHWDALRPPALSKSAAVHRRQQVDALGKECSFMNLYTMLGQPDSTMGSGILYYLYYLPDGLVMAGISSGNYSILPLVRPGGAMNITHQR